MSIPSPLVSLVIPVYKAERFLLDCLQSVTAELRDEYEVILVDDGSPDNSVSIIRENCGAYLDSGQFKLIRIENSGPGEARNVGVRAARGTYIGFLDSDDILLPGYFDDVLEAIRNQAPDIIQFHCNRFASRNKDDHFVIRSHRSSPGAYDLQDVRAEIFGVGKWFPCVRVYLRDLLLAHPFTKGVFYEDVMTLPFLFLGNYRILLLDSVLIGYRLNPDGTTQNHSRAHALTLHGFFEKLRIQPNSIPMSILKTQIARGIIYFAAELHLKDFPLHCINSEIRSICNKRSVSKHLRFADSLYLYAPSIYTYFEHLRHRMRRR